MPNTTLNDFTAKPKNKKPKKGPRKGPKRTSKESIKSFIAKKLKGTEKEIQHLEAKEKKYPYEMTALSMLKMQRSGFKKILEKEKGK